MTKEEKDLQMAIMDEISKQIVIKMKDAELILAEIANLQEQSKVIFDSVFSE